MLYPELKQAHDLVEAHKLVEAGSGYQAALEKANAADDQPGRILAHAGLANVAYWKADFVVAKKEYQLAQETLQKINNPVGLAEIDSNLGNVLWHMGDYPGAREYYRHALSGYEALNMLPQKVFTLRALYLALDPDGDQLLEEALILSRQLGDKLQEANVLQSMGDSLFKKGQLDVAQEKYTEAIELLRKPGNELSLSYALTSEGRLLRAHGHPEKAIPLYREALGIQETQGDRAGAIQSTNAMAVAYQSLDDDATALKLFEKAYAMAKETGSELLINFQLGNLAGAYINVGKNEEAARLLAEVAAKATVNQDIRYSQLGLAYLRLGRYQESVAALNKAIDKAQETKNWDVLPKALGNRAYDESELGQSTLALADAQEALRVVEEVRSHLVPSDFMKRGFSETNQEAYGIYVHLLERAQQPGRALEVAEEARARAFLDLLATRDLQAKATEQQRLTPDGKSATQLQARAATAASNQGSGVLVRGGGSQTGPSAGKADDTEKELPSRARVQPFSLAEVQATAHRLKSTILSYWVTDDTIYIWAVSPGGEIHTAEVRSSLKDLEHLIAGISPGMAADEKKEVRRGEPANVQAISSTAAQKSPVVRQVSARGGTLLTLGPNRRKKWRELYALLIEPVETWLPSQPGTMLTIEPHGPLFMLPFAALTDKQGRYLLERFSLHYTPAVSLLRFTQKREEESRQLPAHYLLVADPAGMPRGPDQNSLPRLPGSRREVAAVASLLPASEVTVLEGKQAGEDKVSRLATQNTVIHLATHGIIRNDQPFDSYLALGVASGDAKGDGRLTAEKIYGMDLHADLVFLSACRSGSGKVSGDGLVGLTRAFWYAGTPSVIASLWDVADEPTYRMVARFYRARAAGSDKSQALRTAQLSLLRQLRAGQVTVHTPQGAVTLPEDPMFWAGFVLQGEP